MAGKNLVKYGDFTAEEAADNEKDLAKGSTEFLETFPGRNNIRFCPAPKPGMKTFEVCHNHRIEIPGTDAVVNFNCPRIMAKAWCPACQAGDRFSASSNPQDRKRAEAFYTRKRVYGRGLHRAVPENGIRPFGFGKTIHERLIFFRKDGVPFTDVDKGFDVGFDKLGTGIKTEYKNIDLARRSTPLASTAELIDELMRNAPDISRHAIILSADEIKAKIDDAGGGGAMEDLSDPAPRSKGSSSTTAETHVDEALDAEFE